MEEAPDLTCPQCGYSDIWMVVAESDGDACICPECGYELDDDEVLEQAV